jgi:hypothetical protein
VQPPLKIDPATHHSRTRPVPNFTRLDPSRPEIAILMDAMLRIREVVATRPWSTSQEPTSEHWWADVLADPRARIRRGRRGFMPNARQTYVIGSPSRSCATNRRRSSTTELSFHGIHTSRLKKAKSVTHVSGTNCHLCLRPHNVRSKTASRQFPRQKRRRPSQVGTAEDALANERLEQRSLLVAPCRKQGSAGSKSAAIETPQLRMPPTRLREPP